MRARARIATWLLAAGAAGVLVPRPEPLLPVSAAGPVVGLALGATLFAVLAGSPVVRVREPRRSAARALYVAARAAYEEALWRLCLLGLLAAAFGAAGGLVLTTAAFALSHWPSQDNRAAVHLLTGGLFGALFLATGSFAAAVAAHATYNALVAVARPFRTLGAPRGAPYDRPDVPAR